jgi:hypothetical protein
MGQVLADVTFGILQPPTKSPGVPMTPKAPVNSRGLVPPGVWFQEP